jgi:hypothetical protein
MEGEDDVDGDAQFALLKKDSLPSSPFVTSMMILFITFGLAFRHIIGSTHVPTLCAMSKWLTSLSFFSVMDHGSVLWRIVL